jgi:hypothetical protein
VFDVYCQSCASRRLIFTSQVEAIQNTATGIHVAYRCWCGARSVWTTGRTHRRAATDRTPQDLPAAS